MACEIKSPSRASRRWRTSRPSSRGTFIARRGSATYSVGVLPDHGLSLLGKADASLHEVVQAHHLEVASLDFRYRFVGEHARRRRRS